MKNTLDVRQKSFMVKCFFSSERRQKICAVCPKRFVCLTNKWTEEDKLAYAKTVPHCILRVPNDEEGREFWKQFKKYLNKERWKPNRQGRAKNRKDKGGCRSHTPIGTCDYFGVYLSDSDIINWQGQKRYEDAQT